LTVLRYGGVEGVEREMRRAFGLAQSGRCGLGDENYDAIDDSELESTEAAAAAPSREDDPILDTRPVLR